MNIALAAASALSLIWPFGQSQTATKEFRLPEWKIATYKDRFTGEVRCRVYQGTVRHPEITYSSRTVAFHFRTSTNTIEAAFRLDSGPVKAWRLEYPKLVKLGVQLEGDSLENPTGGLVVLPIEDVANVHTVTIRPTPKSSPKTFGIDGLSDAVANAIAHGCDPGAGFIR